MGSSAIYPFHQNVLWTFLLGLLSIQIIEKSKKKQKQWILLLIICLVLFMDYLLGTISMVDYNAAGILTVLLFTFPKKTWVSFCGTICRNVLFKCSYAWRSVLSGNYSGTSFLRFHSRVLHYWHLFQSGYITENRDTIASGSSISAMLFYPAHLLILFIIWQWSIR